ncbi:MAG: RNA polymerase factor sigma-54 [Alphaproteobacteria bacterium]|nr:RNA polymerase factor sigma-54 [Alphaproteobacteria bacterium]
MAVGPRLDLRQSQGLVMTPQLQQAIKLLQLSHQELAEYVEQELERNPLLERAEGDGLPEAPEGEPAEAGEAPAGEAETGGDGAEPAETPEAALDTDMSNEYANDSPADQPLAVGETPIGPGKGAGFDDAEGDGLDRRAAESKTLREHLTEQFLLDTEDPIDRAIGMHLIDLVDEAGYLQGELEPIAEKLGCPRQRVEIVLRLLQSLDPAGICARTLAECLALQLIERDRFDPAMQAMIQNLELVARRDIAALVKLCGVDRDDVLDMLAELKRLNPKPGLAFGHEAVQTVVPDVFVRRGPKGDWLVDLNSETLPKVLVNARYHARVASGAAASKADKQYLSECLASANWLVRALDQRATTILKVASELVRRQESFFLRGVEHLRPLILRDIADAIEMHESTVSRVTANKYLACSRGIFELKYFFTAAVPATAGGEAHSAAAVRHRIKTLIEAEPADGVLSDDRLVELLTVAGVNVARRTVAKYREAMGIPSSLERRRLKAQEA